MQQSKCLVATKLLLSELESEASCNILKVALTARYKKRKRGIPKYSSLPFVGVVGFELTTPWSQTRCANRTTLHPDKSYTRELNRLSYLSLKCSAKVPTIIQTTKLIDSFLC